MSNPKHTPGPWQYDSGIIFGEEKVCQIFGDCQVAGREAADSRLIAAAPELLESFEKAIKLIEHMSEKFNYCVAVTISDGHKLINKATGGENE